MKAIIGDRTFALVKSPMKGNRMPKRSNGVLPVIINGTPSIASVTTNRAWSGSPEKTLEYIWIFYNDGLAYYLTLDYAEKASGFAGAEITVTDGVGPKPAARVAVGDRAKVEAARVEKFRAWALAN